MAQLQLKSLLGQLNSLIEKSHNFFGYTILQKEEIVSLIEEIAKCIPADVREAELLLARKDEIIKEAQNRAERIIQDAVNEQSRLINEHEIVKRAQDAVAGQKQQVEQYCENVQNTAIKNAEDIRSSAIREAATIQNEATEYAARIFNGLSANITQMLESVHTCQQALAEQRERQNSAMSQMTNQNNENQE